MKRDELTPEEFRDFKNVEHYYSVKKLEDGIKEIKANKKPNDILKSRLKVFEAVLEFLTKEKVKYVSTDDLPKLTLKNKK